MRITGITVCVDYADLLEHGLATWAATLDDLLVVTSPGDAATHDLCNHFLVPSLRTGVFWQHDAKFNKGAAIDEGFRLLEQQGPLAWVLFFDADIEPPPDWRSQLGVPEPGHLYGCHRVDEHGKSCGDPNMAGFFHLAHASDPHMRVRPVVDTHWYHGGNYDSTFQDRWHPGFRVWLPLTVTHYGTANENWCGRGNKKAMQQLRKERRKRGGWRHETIKRPPQP